MIRLLLTIDTECDKGAGWIVKQPMQFTNIFKGVETYLQPLFDSHHLKATYLLSPEVIKDKASAAYFKKIIPRAELGSHLHAEFIDPESNMESETSKACQNQLGAEVEFEKLKNLTLLFKNTFGYQPISFRAGRFALSPNTLSYLTRLGYEVDSSVTPDTWWMQNKLQGVNFLGAPYQPYLPQNNDFRKSGNGEIVEVPVSIVNQKLANWPSLIKRKINPLKKIQRVGLNKLINPSNNLLWFRPTYSTFNQMRKLIEIYKRKHSGLQDLYLCMMFHSNEFTIDTSPYSTKLKDLNRIKSNLEELLQWAGMQAEFESITLSETKKFLR